VGIQPLKMVLPCLLCGVEIAIAEKILISLKFPGTLLWFPGYLSSSVTFEPEHIAYCFQIPDHPVSVEKTALSPQLLAVLKECYIGGPLF
jgi:hypothetical protein